MEVEHGLNDGIFTWFTVGAKLLRYLVGGGGPEVAELGVELTRLHRGGLLARRVQLVSLLAEAYGKAQRPEEGLAVLVDAFHGVDAGAERYYESVLHRLRGELLLALNPRSPDADACFRRAIGTAKAIGARSLELRAATSLARGLVDRGAASEARAVLAPALGAFTDGHGTGDLRAAAALLARIG